MCFTQLSSYEYYIYIYLNKNELFQQDCQATNIIKLAKVLMFNQLKVKGFIYPQ